MTKQAFLEELNRLTGALSDQERRRMLDYYSEMIDDRVEEGVDEEAAVAALGDVEQLARELGGAAALVPQGDARGASETVDALRNLRLRVASADVSLVRESLGNGAAAQLRFSDPSAFTWRVDGDTLEISENENEGRTRFLWRLRSLAGNRVTLALSGALEGWLDCESHGGDLKAEGLTLGASSRLHSHSGDMALTGCACAGELSVTSQSGDIHLSALSCQGRLKVNTTSGDIRLEQIDAPELGCQTASGDIEADSLEAPDAVRLQTASGDIELRGLKAGELALVTASGDIEVDRGLSRAATVRTASGDTRLDELQADPTLSVESASGDIDLTRCIARQTRLKSVNGEVTLRLEPLPCGYDIRANTVSGSLQIDDGSDGRGDGPRPEIAIRTVSGDISARVL